MTKLVKVQNNQAVTTSLQVAETFDKRHDHVLRDIENLLGGLPKIGEAPMFYETTYQHPQNKQYYKMYYINRDGFTLLAMGFTGDKALEFKLQYIHAFNQMEQQLKTSLPTTYKEALQQLLIQVEEKEQLQQQLMITEPKANKYDQFLNADGYISGENVAKALNIGRNKLYQFLRDNKIWTDKNVPYQRFINQGLFKVVPKALPNGLVASVTLFTTKGIDYVTDKLNKRNIA